MTSTVHMAARNLLRSPRRTLLTGLALGAGFAVTVFFSGFYDGMHRQMVDHGVRAEAGHVVVQGRGWQEERSSSILVRDVSAAIESIREAAPAARVAPRLAGEGVMRARGHAVAVEFTGVDPDCERGASLIADSLVSGEYVSTLEPDGVFIGQRVASTLGVGPGDPVILLSQEVGGTPTERRIVVRGMFRTGADGIDGHVAQLPLATAQAILGVGHGVTQVAVFIDDHARAAEVAEDIHAKLRGEPVEVLTWDQALPGLARIVAIDDAGLSLFMCILYLIMGFGVFNTVMTSVLERVREFGIMLAVGTGPGRVVAMVLAETLVLAAVSVAAGAAVALPVNACYAAYGFDLSFLLPPGYQLGGVALGPDIFFVTGGGRVAAAAGAVTLTAISAAAFPAVRAARMDPVDAMTRV